MPGMWLLFWPGSSVCSMLGFCLNNRLCVLRPGLALVGRKGPVRPQRSRKRKWAVGDSRRVWGGQEHEGEGNGWNPLFPVQGLDKPADAPASRGRCWAGSWGLAGFQSAGSALIHSSLICSLSRASSKIQLCCTSGEVIWDQAQNPHRQPSNRPPGNQQLGAGPDERETRSVHQRNAQCHQHPPPGRGLLQG